MDLAWPAFERIACAFPHARLIHLQGWGEPLLHPRLFDMVAVAKRAGCAVGFTTSGMGLHGDTPGRIAEAGVDLVAVSIAGATRETHEAIRVGSEFARVVDGVRRLIEARRAGTRPRVELLYLMTTRTLAELPHAVELAHSLGVDALVATNLDCVVAREHDALKVFGPAAEACERGAHVDAARDRARALDVSLRTYPLDPVDVAVCDASPLRTLFVCADGSVSPCAWMGLAGQAAVPRWTGGRATEVPRACFGNVIADDLVAIWRSAPYRAFRARFAARRAAMLAGALGMPSRSASPDRDALPAPPGCCATCPKLRGH
jgi:MoaA/NifB/PqqE/SkfB family radical SAM enzyme